MLLLRRLMPYLVAILTAWCLAWQARSPGSYPWVAALAPLAFVAAGFFIGARRIPLGELTARLLTPALALTAGAYALLLAEGNFALWIIPVFCGGVAYVTLELLFLLTFLPTRYPVNGLSHVNLALVPVTFWFVHYTSVGLTMFIHTSFVLPVLALAVTGALLFWCTAHVESSASHRRRWSAIGGWLGAHLGLLGALLPVNVALHGGYAALLGTFALRTRRYGITPSVPHGTMWAETMGIVLLLIVMLATARWV